MASQVIQIPFTGGVNQRIAAEYLDPNTAQPGGTGAISNTETAPTSKYAQSSYFAIEPVIT